MASKKSAKFFEAVIGVAIITGFLSAIAGCAMCVTWNWLSTIFHWPEIAYYQAVGVCYLPFLTITAITYGDLRISE